MITIYDLARETGFSAPTVSKALNGNGKLNEKTRQKILEAAQKFGYKPNMAAKSLSTKHSQLIGIILEDTAMKRGFEHPLFGGLLNQFRKRVESAGYDLLFVSKNFNGGMSYIDHCKFRDLDGILVVNPIEDDPEIKILGSAGIPCVSTNEFIPGVCTVVSENEESGYLAAKKFIENGHKKIGFLGAPLRDSSPASIERFTGFKKGIVEHFSEYNGKYFEICDFWNEEAGFVGMKKLYERCPDVTAIFAVCDAIAFGAIEYLKQIGKDVPNDISFIGFDDDSNFVTREGLLTTFRQDRAKIADISAEILFQVISDIPVPSVVRVPTMLIERNSIKKVN
jgi:LacI family transcriptional regulator